MPMHADYKERLYPILPEIADAFGTPFHIYDETGIRQTGGNMQRVFAALDGFQEYFAVKSAAQPAHPRHHA
jgi:diaminopimelate decarboxylase